MDPLSQASFGASLSQSFSKNKTGQWSAFLVGAVAGMAPDLDVLIRSDEDPLLFLEFHRQFTHSLVFIPVGALIIALFFYAMGQLPWLKKRLRPGLSFSQVYLFSFLGYATHGVLDACTSYGTQLLWPFASTRFAWNTVSIIDPFFTLPILVLILVAAVKQNHRFAQAAFIYAVVFLSAGWIQYQRAENTMLDLAEQRGHVVERDHIKPSFGNRHLWKIMYEYNGRYYVDAVKLLWDIEVIEGSSIQKLNVKRDFPWLPANTQQARDIERFRWFSDGFLAVSPVDKNVIMDVRYSYLPNRIKTMWGIEIEKYYVDHGMADKHVGYVMNEGVDKKSVNEFLEMLF